MITRPSPFPGLPHQASSHRIHVNVFHRLRVFLHAAQRAIEKAPLLQLSGLAAAAPEQVGRAEFDGFHRRRDGERIRREQDGVPMVGQEHPGGQQELLSRADRAEARRQKRELNLIEWVATVLSSGRKNGPKEQGAAAGTWQQRTGNRHVVQGLKSRRPKSAVCATLSLSLVRAPQRGLPPE
jgi:hypothetical protein